MTMATETVGRRPGKTPLIKQPEIEEVEEEKGEEQTGSPNSDKSDTTITAGIDTPCANSASSGSPDTGSPNEQSQDSSEKQEPAAKVNHMQSKPKTLQRAEAFRDDSSPPPAIVAGVYPAEEQIEYGEIVELATIPGSRSLEKDGSQSSEAGTSSTLSRESSLDTQYKDSTGIDLEEFIKKTLNKSVKDRKMMLQLAKDLKKFIKEPKHQFLQFAEMSSYDRMLIHRVAAFFGLDHNVDQSGKAVIVSKTKITRIPDFNFEDHIQRTGDSQLKNSQRKIVLVRKAPSLEEKESKGLEKHQFGNNRAKSLEERQKSYEEAKARIFKNGEGQDVLAYPLLRSGKSSLVSSKEDLGSRQHSTDSSGYGSSENSNKSRICMHKSNSYGGMTSHAPLKFQSGSLSKADSVSSGASGSFESPPMRPYPVPLSPPGSHSDQSQLSRSSSTGPIQSPHTSCSNITSQGSPYAFLVAMDTNTIPPGSMIVNPQTLQPHHNPDGSVYRYDPAQPPPWLMGGGSVPQSVSTQSFPSNMPSPYSSEQEVCQRFPSMTISHQSQDIMQDSQGGSAPQPPQGSQVLMSSQAPFPAQQPGTYIQQSYYGPQGVTGQPVRYMYQMPYLAAGHQSQGSVDGQSPSSSTVPYMGQYPQQFVQSYPANYQNVVLQHGPSQSTEMTSSNMSQTSIYPSPHTNNNIPGVSSFSIQYGPYSQSSYGQPQSPVFYSVSSSPQMGYSFTGQGSTLRPTTPPSQGTNNVANPSLAINMGQPVNFAQPGSTTGHTHPASSPQYGTYPVFPQVHQNQMRPINQVVQISGVQSQHPSQQFSVVRPSMQVNMQGNLPQQGNMGQHTMSVKGYSVSGCYQKPVIGNDGAKETIPTPTLLSGAVAHIPGPSHIAGGPGLLAHQQLGSNDMRMIGSTNFRPQLQPLQFSQKQHPTTHPHLHHHPHQQQQPPKPRE